MPIYVRQEKDEIKRAINNVSSALNELNAAYEKYKKAQDVLDKLQQSINAKTPNPTGGEQSEMEIDRLRSLSGTNDANQ